MVPRTGIEPVTRGFSIYGSYIDFVMFNRLFRHYVAVMLHSQKSRCLQPNNPASLSERSFLLLSDSSSVNRCPYRSYVI